MSIRRALYWGMKESGVCRPETGAPPSSGTARGGADGVKRPAKILLPVGAAGAMAGSVVLAYVASLCFSADDVAALMPPSPAARVALALLLFLLQGVVPFLLYGPIVITCGVLFDTWTAFCVGTVGTALSMVAPYLVGRLAPDAWVRARLERYPRFWRFAGGEPEASFLFSYFLRAVGLSNKALGLFFGLARMSFFAFLLSGVLGTLPSMAGYLLLGQAWGLGSPWMWAAFLMNMLIVGALAFRSRRRERHADRDWF